MGIIGVAPRHQLRLGLRDRLAEHEEDQGAAREHFIMASKIDRMFPSWRGSSPFSVEPAFSAGASLSISASTTFPFESHQGIRTAAAHCSVLTIRNFNRSRPTFTISGPLRMHSPALTG